MSATRCADTCHGCCCSLSRRHFLWRCGTAAAAAAATGTVIDTTARAATGRGPNRKVRVAAVFLCNIDIREIWPYPGFDTQRRQTEVLAALRTGCPEIEFVDVAVKTPADASAAAALKDDVDGYFIHTMTLDWSHGAHLISLAQLGKPTLVADEYLGGSGVFLTGLSALRDREVPVAAVSSANMEDVIAVARVFANLQNSDVTPERFASQCEQAYRATFPPAGTGPCAADPVPITGIGECVKRLRETRFLIIGAGAHGQERDFLGATGLYLDFDPLRALYDHVDRDQAAQWAGTWTQQAQGLPPGEYVEPRQPHPEAVHDAATMYLATLELLKKHGTDTVTANCLGGFAAGTLPAYPCLGFMQLLNDGAQGVCEAMPDDTISMLMARILTGRPGFVSDPVLDTSRNQVVYAHCVGTTKVFGPDGEGNGFRIRTLHNRDPRGACAESIMPAGYMTTSFRTNVDRKQMVIHQARAAGTLDSERGCRTKLLGEVHGDIGKMFDHWSRFSWHRVTVYGDVKEPLAEFGRALGLEVIEEA